MKNDDINKYDNTNYSLIIVLSLLIIIIILIYFFFIIKYIITNHSKKGFSPHWFQFMITMISNIIFLIIYI